ncbi:STAS domain-containing protein [Candidatus Uabimicrobium amorphum]|uniref:STAS domain-containing protein n=1 Tax=Uabimicrobium amorphum TaxID=2596890 RepID=A0A5S9ISS9_UABAM|nr:STAS domain-containing protein [Candidatus Uabimicrobium amorphum]BBM85995.1 hypothetical protein UABAM_04381 [Candidatus Uabimicrobium amorphum]
MSSGHYIENIYTQKSITETIEKNSEYRGCCIYVKKQSTISNCVFDNCSFREDIEVGLMKECFLNNCSLRNVKIHKLQVCNFSGGHIDYLELDEGANGSLWSTNIDLLLLKNTYKICRIPHKDIMHVKVCGMISGCNVRELERMTLGSLEKGNKKLVVDFESAVYGSSTGMGILVKIADGYLEQKGAIVLTHVPEKMIALFEMLGLATILPVFPDLPSAIKAFEDGTKYSF